MVLKDCLETWIVADRGGAERRGSERVRTIYRTARISTLADRGLCLVHNLSDGGAMVETGLELLLNDNVQLALEDGQRLRGRVAWHNGKYMGIRFLAPIDSCALLRAWAQDHWSRKSRAPRLAICKRATIRTSSGTFSATIHDISQRGMSARYIGALDVAQRVDATLEGGLELTGLVRWAQAGAAGIQFSNMLTVEQLGSVRLL